MPRKGTQYHQPLPIVERRSKPRKTDRQYGAIVALIRSRTGIITAHDFEPHVYYRRIAHALNNLYAMGELTRITKGRAGKPSVYLRAPQTEFRPAEDSPVAA